MTGGEANGRPWPLVVVGAGPAGVEAAATAAEHGIRVLLIDAYARPGGQYFRQLPGTFSTEDRTRHQRQADLLLQRLAHPCLQYLPDTVAWYIAHGEGRTWELGLNASGSLRRVVAEWVVLAVGAYDRPVAFPGWTLPGVMTAGGVQALLKSQRVLPGRRFLLSGAGPLQLAVAAAQVRAGGEVAAVLEGAAVGRGLLQQLVAAWGQWERLAEALDYVRVLGSARVPVRSGWSVIAAEGREQVEAAVVARLDDTWQPVRGSEERIEVDTIVIGYGFVPSTELSRLVGCEHVYQPGSGGWVPVRNALMQTTRPGVYVAGDAHGIAGAAAARLEGRIAALDIVRRVQSGAAAEREIASTQGRLKWERRFATALAEVFTPGPGLDSLVTDETVICRCENVTVGQIKAALSDGARTPGEVKGLTCVGMGNCQGRICGVLVPRLVARQLALMGLPSPAAPELFTMRSPVYPVPLGSLAEFASAEPFGPPGALTGAAFTEGR